MLVADGRVSVTIHWLPPLQSDLPVNRYKVSDLISDLYGVIHVPYDPRVPHRYFSTCVCAVFLYNFA